MTIRVNELINALAQFSEEKQLKAAATESLKGGLLAGASALFGGLLLGPVGLALGGAIGGIAGAVSSKGKFQSVAIILKNLPPQKKELLYDKLMLAFTDFGVDDVVNLGLLLASNTSFQELAMRQLTAFMSNQLSMTIEKA